MQPGQREAVMQALMQTSGRVRACSVPAIPWLPSLGLQLVLSGCLLIVTGMTDTPRTLGPPGSGAWTPPLVHAVEVPGAATKQTSAASLAVRHPATRAIGQPQLLISADALHGAGDTSGSITMHHHRKAGPMALVRPGIDIRGGSPRPSPCLKTDLEQGTRAESAQLATIPLRRDPREALIMLAAVQHGGPGTWSGSCLMRRLTVQDPVQADSDDRIANALAAPDFVASPQPADGPR